MPVLSPSERDALIVRHAPLVQRLAWRMAARLPPGFDVDDLASVGMIGLIEAVDRYEESRAGSFTAYAKIRIRGAMLDDLRRNDHSTRPDRDLGRRIRHAREKLTARFGQPPSVAELCAELGMDEEELHHIESRNAPRTMVSIDAQSDTAPSLAETLPAPDDDPDAAFARIEEYQELHRVLARLPPRERWVAEMYYLRELSLKEIGALMGVTESRVAQIHTRLKARLRGLYDLDRAAA